MGKVVLALLFLLAFGQCHQADEHHEAEKKKEADHHDKVGPAIVEHTVIDAAINQTVKTIEHKEEPQKKDPQDEKEKVVEKQKEHKDDEKHPHDPAPIAHKDEPKKEEHHEEPKKAAEKPKEHKDDEKHPAEEHHDEKKHHDEPEKALEKPKEDEKKPAEPAPIDTKDRKEHHDEKSEKATEKVVEHKDEAKKTIEHIEISKATVHVVREVEKHEPLPVNKTKEIHEKDETKKEEHHEESEKPKEHKDEEKHPAEAHKDEEKKDKKEDKKDEKVLKEALDAGMRHARHRRQTPPKDQQFNPIQAPTTGDDKARDERKTNAGQVPAVPILRTDSYNPIQSPGEVKPVDGQVARSNSTFNPIQSQNAHKQPADGRVDSEYNTIQAPASKVRKDEKNSKEFNPIQAPAANRTDSRMPRDSEVEKVKNETLPANATVIRARRDAVDHPVPVNATEHSIVNVTKEVHHEQHEVKRDPHHIEAKKNASSAMHEHVDEHHEQSHPAPVNHTSPIPPVAKDSVIPAPPANQTEPIVEHKPVDASSDDHKRIRREDEKKSLELVDVTKVNATVEKTTLVTDGKHHDKAAEPASTSELVSVEKVKVEETKEVHLPLEASSTEAPVQSSTEAAKTEATSAAPAAELTSAATATTHEPEHHSEVAGNTTAAPAEEHHDRAARQGDH